MPNTTAYYGNEFLKDGKFNVNAIDAITMNVIQYGLKVAGVPTTFDDLADIEGYIIESQLETLPYGNVAVLIYRAADGAVDAYVELGDALNEWFSARKTLIETSINYADTSIQGLLDISKTYIEAGGYDYISGKTRSESFFTQYDSIRENARQAVQNLRENADHPIFFFARPKAQLIDREADRIEYFLEVLPSSKELYKIGYENAKALDELTDKKEESVISQSTLKIAVKNGPTGELPIGEPFYFRGSITSNYEITKATVSILNSSGSTVQTKSVYPNKKSVDILADGLDDLKFGKLSEGSYTLTLSVTDKSGASALWKGTFSIVSTASTVSTLAINVTSAPKGDLIVGNPFYFSGSITSNYPISSATVSIVNTKGKIEQSKTVTPNVTVVDILASGLDDLKFGKLSCGTYTFKLVVSDTSGKTLQWDSKFSIVSQPASLSIQMTSSPSGSLPAGKPFYCKGSIISDYLITSATVSIKDANGQVVQTKTVHPNKKTVDILKDGLDDLKFGTLKRGSYTFYLSATDQSGAQDSWSSNFSIT